MITIVERLEYRASPCGDDTQKYLLLSYIKVAPLPGIDV